MGFVIEIPKGPVLYHAGDTDVFAGMSLIAERYHPTVAMLPIGGHFTMDPTGAALAAKLLKVKTVIPMHFGTFPPLKGTPDELRAALKKAEEQRQGRRAQARRDPEALTLTRPLVLTLLGPDRPGLVELVAGDHRHPQGQLAGEPDDPPRRPVRRHPARGAAGRARCPRRSPRWPRSRSRGSR